MSSSIAGKYSWTDSKTSLVELIYAIHHSASINKGSSDIKELAHLFQEVFNIDLGDYYRTYLEIKNRTEPSKYLDTLRKNLNDKISEDYEK